MKIRMKVKHLALCVVGMLAFIPLMTFFISPQIELLSTKYVLKQGGEAGKKRILVALESNIMQSQKWDIIKEHMLVDSLVNRFDVYVGPSFSQVNQDDISRFTWSEKLPYIQEYVQNGPVDGYLTNAAKQLASYYDREGQYGKGNDVLIQAIERFSKTQNTWDKEELMLERVKLALNHSELNKAEDYLHNITEQLTTDNDYRIAEISQLKTEIILRQGNLKAAYEEVKKELEEYKEKWEKEKEEFPETANDIPVVYEQLQSLEWQLSRAIQREGDSIVTVTGKVARQDGAPLENIGVFLREGTDVNSSVRENEPYQQLTDENGVFEFQGVIPGNYQLYLGFMFDQIDGLTWPIDMNEWIEIDGSKDVTYNITLHELLEIESPVNQQKIMDKDVHFAWEAVEGATYYELHLGLDIDSGSIATVFKTHIKENHLDVPIEQLYDQTAGVVFSGDDLSTVDPISILAFANTDNRFSWSVEAYDSDGELITRSNGYRLNEDTIGNLPFFYLKERQMTKADRLLLDNKGKEALKAYKESYEKDPNDIHSLRMIVRMIRATSHTENDEDLVVLPYLEDLAKKSALPQNTFWLVEHYYQTRQWESFNNWMERYQKLQNGTLNEYDQAIYASALMKQGKLQEANEQFEEVMNIDKSNRFVGSWLAVEIYLSESFNKALKIARDYPERQFGKESRDWLVMIRNLQQEESLFTNYQQELRDVLDLYFSGKEEELTDWLKTTDKKQMKKFIKAVKAVR